jgi:hypothetical protein
MSSFQRKFERFEFQTEIKVAINHLDDHFIVDGNDINVEAVSANVSPRNQILTVVPSLIENDLVLKTDFFGEREANLYRINTPDPSDIKLVFMFERNLEEIVIPNLPN